MNEFDIKPCKCGSKASAKPFESSENLTVTVVCDSCGAVGPTVQVENNGRNSMIETAIAAIAEWNKQ